MYNIEVRAFPEDYGGPGYECHFGTSTFVHKDRNHYINHRRK